MTRSTIKMKLKRWSEGNFFFFFWSMFSWDVVMKVCRFVLWWKMLSLVGDWVMGGIKILYFLCSTLCSSIHNLLCIFLTFLIKQSKFKMKKKKWQVTQIMVQSICIPLSVFQHTVVPWCFFWFGVWLTCWGFKCVNFYKLYFCILYGCNIIVKIQMYAIMNSSTNLSTSRTFMNLIYLVPTSKYFY